MRTSQHGVSLIEVLVASAIFGMIIVALVGAYLTGQQSTALAGARERATLLADEGIEAVRIIKENGWSNLVDGTYGLAMTGDSWVLSGNEDTIGRFSRTITIQHLTNTTADITSRVTWEQTALRPGEITITTRLTDWSQATATGVFRAREYYIAPGSFTGTTYDLTLNNPLADNYFVIIRGSDGDGSNIGDRGPDENYIALTGDPLGTGELNTSAATNILSFTRHDAVDSWVGVITVVECLNACTSDGFVLRDVQRVVHTGATTSGTDTSAGWDNIDQVLLMGGYRGAGCDTTVSSSADHKACHARIWPSGTDTVNWERNANGATLDTATSTVMAIEWGSSWNVQRTTISGNAGADGAGSVSAYATASIDAVDRDRTWVWGAGVTDTVGVGSGTEGVLITLGDGVNQNTTESTVSVGQEYASNKTFEVYTLSHPLLTVDYRFKADGHSDATIYDQAVDAAPSSAARMSIVYNGQAGTDASYPRPIFSTRYVDSETIRLERRRTGQPWPAWIQGVDFSQIVPSWWDTNYAYRSQLSIATGPNPPAQTYDGYTVRAVLSTNQLINQGKIQADCRDLRVVHEINGVWQELDRVISDCDSNATAVQFKLIDDIADNASDPNYYLYYGFAGAGQPNALDTTNVYLWYDDVSTDRSTSYTFGRCDPWQGNGYTAWSYNAAGHYEIDTGRNSTGCFRYAAGERDAYIEAEFYHTGCYQNNMTTGLISRYSLGSGSGASESSNDYYASNRAENKDCGKELAHDGDICEGGRCPLGIDGKKIKFISTAQWRKQALAVWGINATQLKYWDGDDAGTFGPAGFPSGQPLAEGADNSDVENAGDWGIVAANDTVQVRNILMRRYTEPEPTVTVGSEEPQP